MSKSSGIEAAYKLLDMRNEYDSIPEKDKDLEFLVDKVLIALNILLPNKKKYTESGQKSIRPQIRKYAKKIRDAKK